MSKLPAVQDPPPCSYNRRRLGRGFFLEMKRRGSGAWSGFGHGDKRELLGILVESLQFTSSSSILVQIPHRLHWASAAKCVKFIGGQGLVQFSNLTGDLGCEALGGGKFTRASDTQQKHFSGVLWSLWKERNERVWQQRSKPEDLVMRMGIDTVEEWAALERVRGDGALASGPKGCGEWHPPAEPLVKINFDAAIFQQDHLHGAGAALRSHDGALLGFKQELYRGTPPARECEATALLMTIRWVKELQLQRVILKSDCQELVSAIGRDEEDESEFGDCDLWSNTYDNNQHHRRWTVAADHHDQANGNNYVRWSQSVKMYVCDRGKIGYLTRTTIKLEKGNPEFNVWDAKNSMVMTWLVNSMTTVIGTNYLGYATAKELWTDVDIIKRQLILTTFSSPALEGYRVQRQCGRDLKAHLRCDFCGKRRHVREECWKLCAKQQRKSAHQDSGERSGYVGYPRPNAVGT
ncbi:hypothetical protein LINPERHAP1_LOCUS30020 [Linum perenne]